MLKRYALSAFLLGAMALTVVSCKDDDKEDPKPGNAAAGRVDSVSRDLPADTGISGNIGGRPVIGRGKFTFYSLREHKVIPNSDSATNKWDIGFRGTTICVNGGASGPGQGAALMANGIFADLKTAPTTGYKTDSLVNGSKKYFLSSNPSARWYNYIGKNEGTPQQYGIIVPVPGNVIWVKTADGKYAKVEIISYYRGVPADPNNLTINQAGALARFYTFRYSVQTNGSANF